MGRAFGCGGCGCGLVAILLLAGAAYVGYQLFFNVPEKSAVVTATPVATSVPAPTAAAQFDAKVATAVVQAKAGGSKQPVRLLLTEAELSAKASQAAASAPGAEAVRDVVVKIKEGLLVLTGRTQLAGREVPVEAEVKLSAAENRLKVDVASVKAGGLPIPVSGPIQDMVADQLRKAIGGNNLQGVDLGFDVKNVKLANGHLEIEGMTR